MARPKESRVERLYRTHALEGQRLAQLLCEADPEMRANRAFVRAVATFRDLRSPMTFDASFRRAVIKECRPSIVRTIRGRLDRTSPIEGGDLWSAFRVLSHRRRSALVLRYYESMSDEQVAEVLGCSTGAARARVNRGLNALKMATTSDANAGRVAGELQRLFNAHAEREPDVLEPEPHVIRRAVIGRRINAVGALVAALSVAIAGIVAVRAGLQAEDSSPPPTSVEEPAEIEVLSLQDHGLQPDARIDAKPNAATVATGAFGGNTWHLLARRGPSSQICLELRVGAVERLHCESRALSALHAFVDSFEESDATFITGYALDQVAQLALEVDDGDAVRVELVPAPESLPRALQRQFFVIVLPEALTPLESEDDGAGQGLDVIRTVLQARDVQGTATEHQPIYLGR